LPPRPLAFAFGRRRLRMYSFAMARKIGVLCASCGKAIEIDDDYVPGLPPGFPAGELAASIYRRLLKSVQAKIPYVPSRPWRKILTCENPDCLRTHTYGTSDLRLYDDESGNM